MKKINLLFATVISLSLVFSTSAFADTHKKIHKKKAQQTTSQHVVKNTVAGKKYVAKADTKNKATKKKSTNATQHAANTKLHSKKKLNKNKSTHAA